MIQETVPDAPLAWLPPTLAATALRLYSLDVSLLYDHDAPPARDLLASYAYTQRPALPAAVAKELHAAPASDPAAVADASTTRTNVVADGRVHTVLGPALAGEGRAIVNRLPPLPASLLLADGQPFAVDEARLQQTSPVSGGRAGNAGKAAGYVAIVVVHNALLSICSTTGQEGLGVAAVCVVSGCLVQPRRLCARHASAGER